MKPRRRVLVAVYVLAVAGFAASAWWSPNRSFTWSREGVALLLTLPALILALPVIYIGGALVWNLTNASPSNSGTVPGPMWPVTVVYTLMFTCIAIANVWLLLTILRRAATAAPGPPAAATDYRAGWSGLAAVAAPDREVQQAEVADSDE